MNDDDLRRKKILSNVVVNQEKDLVKRPKISEEGNFANKISNKLKETAAILTAEGNKLIDVLIFNEIKI